MELHLGLQVALRFQSSDQQLGTFPGYQLAEKSRQHYHHERKHKNKKIHNKINIMLHDIHVYDFKVF